MRKLTEIIKEIELSDCGEENNDIELPKIFSKPKNVGDLMSILGEVFAWAVLVTFFVGLPFYFKDGYSSIASNKYIFFIYAAKYTAICGAVLLFIRLLIWGFTKKELLAYKNLLLIDIFAVAFASLSFISYSFSAFKESDLGTNNITEWFYQGPLYGLSGWYMGFITYLVFVMLYFIISRCLIYNKCVFVIPVISVTVVSLWGILNRYGVAPIDMNYNYKDATAAFLGPIGNINWFCGFTSVLVPIIWGLYMSVEKIWQRITYMICMAITFEMIIVNSSDSGYFAVIATLMVLFGYTLTDKEKLKKFFEIALCLFTVSTLIALQDLIFVARSVSAGNWERFIGVPSLVILIILGVAYVYLLRKKNWDVFKAQKIRTIYISFIGATAVLLVLFIVVNTAKGGGITDNPLFVFKDEWGSGRGITWTLGIQTFMEMNLGRKLIGSGPDTFYYEMITFSNLSDRVTDFFGGARLTNAHNEIITLLVNVGLLGTISFLGIIIASVKASFKYAHNRPEMIGFGLATISYLLNNMFSFQQITNIPFLFIVIGMEGAAIVVYSKATVRLTKKERKNKMQKGKIRVNKRK